MLTYHVCHLFLVRGVRIDNNTTYDDENDEDHPYKWSFYNSVFFSLITASTVGYGNVSPFSSQGKILVIFYSLFGVPYFGIMVSQLGEFFSSIFVKAHSKYKAKVYETRTGLLLEVLKYLIPGIFVFVIAPALLISHMENWPLITAIYYSYITLTTIGYGDYVAGHLGDLSVGYAVYKAFLLFWIMIGLGYLLMILGFISRAMRSKRVKRLEQRLAGRIKRTQTRIWKEFVNDVSHVRRILNEMYLQKVKPVYKESKMGCGGRPRGDGLSRSCPELSEWPVLRKVEIEEALDVTEESGWKRRAFSESGWEVGSQLPRVLSEGQLTKVDMEATFERAPFLEPASLLAKVVNNFEAEEEEIEKRGSSLQGINMFSDEEILATENGGGVWSIGGEPLRQGPLKEGTRRRRALSEATNTINPLHNYYVPYEQKTWTSSDVTNLHQWALIKNTLSVNNGNPTKLEEGNAVVDREEEAPQPNALRRVSLAALSFLKGGVSSKPRSEEEKKSKLKEDRLSLQETSSPGFSNMEFDNSVYMEGTGDRRLSFLDALGSSGMGTTVSPILEQTSLADFIRVMATIKRHQSQSATEDEVRDEFTLPGETEIIGRGGIREGRRRSSPGISPNSLGFLIPGTPHRRFSRLHPGISTNSLASQRRASLSPIEIIHRRRFSHVPNISTSTLSSDDGVFATDVPVLRQRAASTSRFSPKPPIPQQHRPPASPFHHSATPHIHSSKPMPFHRSFLNHPSHQTNPLLLLRPPLLSPTPIRHSVAPKPLPSLLITAPPPPPPLPPSPPPHPTMGPSSMHFEKEANNSKESSDESLDQIIIRL